MNEVEKKPCSKIKYFIFLPLAQSIYALGKTRFGQGTPQSTPLSPIHSLYPSAHECASFNEPKMNRIAKFPHQFKSWSKLGFSSKFFLPSLLSYRHCSTWAYSPLDFAPTKVLVLDFTNGREEDLTWFQVHLPTFCGSLSIHKLTHWFFSIIFQAPPWRDDQHY